MPSPPPLVTIVVPAYNCASYINETLQSVYQQTYRNWEIILVDDGSTDATRSALDPHMSRVRYFYQKNHGTAAARNAGVRRARGDLIAFLDNDDLWLPEKLELQVQAMRDWPDAGLVFTDGKSFTRSGIRADSVISRRLDRWIHQNTTTDPTVVKGSLLRELFFANEIASASSVMIRAQCLAQVGGFDETITVTDDFDLWLRIAQRYPIALIRSPLYMWRWREDSLSGPVHARHLRWTETSAIVLEKHWRAAPSDIRRAVRAHLSGMYWKCGRTHFQFNQFSKARQMLSGCLHHRKFFVPAMLFYLVSYLSPSLLTTLREVKRQTSRRWRPSSLPAE